ncbi:MAG: uncharacterized DUF497 family protein [Patiriisocius sp.]|jgi:uncharacterized DUF497 family protein
MASFLWDAEKDEENRKKHEISFDKAQYAFADPNRILAIDTTHSATRETRYFCFGDLEDGIVTVRRTYRNEVIRIFGAGYWRKGKRIYEG